MKNKTIPEEVEQIVFGSLLGDAGLQKTPNQRVLYRESHSLKQEDYLLWKEKVLCKFFGKFKRYYYKNREHIQISSKTHPSFAKLYKIFYPNTTRKIIPLEILNQLKPLGLAVWYMDDGGLQSCGCLISISNKKDREIVKEKLKEIFNFNVTINKNDRVYFNKKEAYKFRKLIKPYIHPNIKYKIELEDNRNKTKKIGRKNYWKNPEKNRKRAVKYYYDKNEERLKYRKEYYQKNKERERKKGREYYQKNKDNPKFIERRKEHDKKYYLKHKEEILKQKREHYKKTKREKENEK